MKKTLLYRLFGIGKIPRHMAPVLKQEGIILSDEGLSGSVTYRNFRAPGKWFTWRRHWFLGSVALTHKRFTAFEYSWSVIDIPMEDPRLGQLQYSVEKQHTLCVAFDPSLFHEGWSGIMEYRFSTPHAKMLLNFIKEKTA
jgi:hypothetical protein